MNSDDSKIQTIASHFEAILKELGLDTLDPNLAKTPQRVARMYLNEVFSGLKEDNFPKISFFPAEKGRTSMITVKCGFVSFCEHHFVPFQGTAHVAYRAKDKLIGLSKIPRIVRYFARRPQLQERLTMQVADKLSELLETPDVAVSIKATHFCVLARGIQDSDSQMYTQILRGDFETDASLRQEFFSCFDSK